MGTLLLRSFGLLVLFQMLAVAVLWAGSRRRATLVALGLGIGLGGLAYGSRDAEAALFLGGGVAAGWLIERAVRRGWSLWPTVLLGSIPVVLTAVFGLVSPDPRHTWRDLSAQVDSLAVGATVPTPTGDRRPKSGGETNATPRRHRGALGRCGCCHGYPGAGALQVLPLVVVAGGFAQRARRAAAVLPVSGWQVPFVSVWGLALGLGLAASGVAAARVVGANIVMAVGTALAVQGLAVLWSWLERALPPPARALLLASMVLAAWPFLAVALALLGTADLWLDFRRLRAVTEDS
jgi:hypothetical protein